MEVCSNKVHFLTFRPIIRKYYKDTTMNFDGDRTRALFNFLNEKPQALAIPNLSTETTAPMNAVVKNLQPKEEFSVFCDRTAIVEEPAPAKCSSVKVSAAAVIKSPAQKQRRISVILNFYLIFPYIQPLTSSYPSRVRK